MKLGESNFRCTLIKSKACSGNNEYHLLVIYNHAVGDGTSGMIITNQILTLYDEALENQDVLKSEINAEIVKTWETKIQPEIPNGNQNYDVSSFSFTVRVTRTDGELGTHISDFGPRFRFVPLRSTTTVFSENSK